MYKRLEEIPYGYIPKVLFVGNGINRAYSNESWDDFIKSLSDKELSDEDEKKYQKLPYQLRPVVITEDHVDATLKEKAGDIVNSTIDEKLKDQYRDLCGIGFDAILTSNYTYEIEQSLSEEFSIEVGKASKYRFSAVDRKLSNDMCLHQYMKVSENDPSIWHVHGECAKPGTMVLGHYYYGKLLSKFPKETESFQKRYSMCNKERKSFIPHSWVDYFLISEIYFVGFGLGFDEIDVWWLLNWRKRHTKNGSRVHFFEQIPKKKEIEQQAKFWMAKTYNVDVKDCTSRSGDYKDFYRQVTREISGEILEHKEMGIL